jgi:hypothetical protein
MTDDQTTDQPAERSELRSRGRKRAPVKPGTRPAKRTSTHSGGRPAFVPTSSERRFVQAMAGLRMSAEEICKVVGGSRARDTDSGKPISKTTLFRHFKTELASGRAMLKARVAGKFYNALDEDQPWAIQMAMRNQFGWDAGRGGFDGAQLIDEREPVTAQVTFVVPGGAGSSTEGIPDAPAPPFPWQRALPKPVDVPMFRDPLTGAWRSGPTE